MASKGKTGENEEVYKMALRTGHIFVTFTQSFLQAHEKVNQEQFFIKLLCRDVKNLKLCQDFSKRVKKKYVEGSKEESLCSKCPVRNVFCMFYCYTFT